MIVRGLSDGLREGLLEGEPLGSLLSEGLSEGLSERLSLGCSDGTSLGLADGLQVGQPSFSQSSKLASASRQGHKFMQFSLHDPSRLTWAIRAALALLLIMNVRKFEGSSGEMRQISTIASPSLARPRTPCFLSSALVVAVAALTVTERAERIARPNREAKLKPIMVTVIERLKRDERVRVTFPNFCV